MILVITMIPVIIVLAIFYFTVIKRMPKTQEGLAYIIVVALSFIYFLPHGAYFLYMGIENLPLGVALVWANFNWNKVKQLIHE